MRDRWTTDQVTALAPDAPSMAAARGLSTAAKWVEHGAGDGPPATIWGLAKGSGSKPYQTCVDLDEPAYRCSCPSRKFPCKHALGLLLMWASGSVVVASETPGWVLEWHESRAGRAAKAEARRVAGAEPKTEAQEKAASKRAAQRDDRVASGVVELAQWLDDQVAGGIAGLDRVGYKHWDLAAARLVDAQAPGLARRVRDLAGVAGSRDGWDQRLLAELGTLRLLTTAYARVDSLPADLAETVRGHVGFTTPIERVLETPPIRDIWQVIGVRDESDERLTTRRSWLVGRDTGRVGLVLAFAVAGQPIAADLVMGTAIDADICFYPGATPLRATVSIKHGAPARCATPTPASTVNALLDRYADAVAADPWLDIWPALLHGVLVPGTTWHLVDDAGDALPIRTRSNEPWHLVGAAGGSPATYSAEWSTDGLRLLAGYIDGEVVGA